MRARTSFFGSLAAWFRDAVTANLGLKSLSLVVALGIVAYTRGQLDDTKLTIPVALVHHPPPESARRVLMTTMPAEINVTVEGPTRAIESLIRRKVTPVYLDLRDGRQQAVTFTPSMFSVPPDVEIKYIQPDTLSLEWQDVITRTIPVQPSRTGQPAQGFEVRGDLQVKPDKITVEGPESLVEVMQFARLAAFDVSGLSEGVYRRQIAIDDPPTLVRYLGSAKATVLATIARRQIEAKFARRPVEVIGPKRAKTTPKVVDVTVRGPPEVVAALRDDQIVPRVDLASAGIDVKEEPHGAITLKVRAELAKAETEIQPPTVSVRW